ncbi:MAG: bile acid-coenzyme ligase [Microbacteriaceae bacterium]|nr:bile acid-coenzyme ligase [Microbacteriaceae bacterium]
MTRMTISRAITSLAARDPGRLAVRDDDEVLSRAELDSRSNSLARTYAALGVKQDDLVTVTLPNCVEFVVSCVAIWKLGATPQPLSHRLPLPERRAVVELATSALVVGGSATEYPGTVTLHAGFRSTESDAILPDAAARSWKAPTSSGSTGQPKIVLATAGAIIDPDAQVAAFIPHEAVQLVAGPLYHSAPFTYAMRGLMSGHSLVVLPRFDEARVLRAIDEHEVTWMMMVPTMMNRIWNLPEPAKAAADLASLESFVHLGAPCDPALKRNWIQWLGPSRINEVYAGTESAGLTMITGSEWLERPGSVGKPIGGSRMRVVDERGNVVPRGTVGRIEMTREGGAPFRYLGRETPDTEWMSLGDDGRMDDDGYLWVIDRADDVIVSGRVTVYPIEVERVLEQHPLVRSAVAFGVPDADLGALVHAIVDIADAELSTAELLVWARASLAPEMVPRMMELSREPVRDDAGKVRRSILARDRADASTSP